jgi:hypothetical protein
MANVDRALQLDCTLRNTDGERQSFNPRFRFPPCGLRRYDIRQMGRREGCGDVVLVHFYSSRDKFWLLMNQCVARKCDLSGRNSATIALS